MTMMKSWLYCRNLVLVIQQQMIDWTVGDIVLAAIVFFCVLLIVGAFYMVAGALTDLILGQRRE